MNRRKFLQSIAAIPLVGPAAAMAASSLPAGGAVVKVMPVVDSVRITLPADDGFAWFIIGSQGLMELRNGEWIRAVKPRELVFRHKT